MEITTIIYNATEQALADMIKGPDKGKGTFTDKYCSHVTTMIKSALTYALTEIMRSSGAREKQLNSISSN